MTASTDRVALITGCSTGIGRAVAEEGRRRGWRVVATARDPADVADLADDRRLTLALDVTDEASVEAAVAAATEWGGGIEVLVNNAGYGLIGPVAEIGLDELRRQLETNVVGAVAMIRAVVPQMAARRRGCIVNIGSVSARLATPFGGAYSASKAALHLLSDALRAELAPFGIDVVVVQAGAVATRFADTAADGLDRVRETVSLYRDRLAGMEKRAAMSRNLAMPAPVFANRLWDAVERRRRPAVLRIGGGALIVPMLAMLPRKLLARMLGRKFGLR